MVCAAESWQTICLFDSLVLRSRLLSRLLSISRFGFVAAAGEGSFAEAAAVAVGFTFRYLDSVVGSEAGEATPAAEDGPDDTFWRTLFSSGSHALW